MGFELSLHILPFAGSALVLTLMLHVAWRNRNESIGRWFAASLLAMIIWAVGYALEISALSLDGKIFYANLQYLGVATVSVCWWEMIRRYLGLHRIPKVITGFLWLVSSVTIIVAFLNPGDIFRRDPFINTIGSPFPVLHAGYGPWYTWVLIPTTVLVNMAVLTLLARAVLRARGFYRRQYLILLIALVLPFTCTVVYVLDLGPWKDYNLTAAVAGISGLLLMVGLFKWQLFDIVPPARDIVIEDLASGVFVVDAGGRLVDLNRSAERLMSLERGESLGRPAKRVLADYPVLLEVLEAPAAARSLRATRREMVIKRHGVATYLAVTSSPVTTHRGRFLGSAVVLHDVTERVRLLEQAREMANKDDLTGLPNRRHFFELTAKEFERARRYGAPASFLLMDVDHFKLVNDTFGHRTGDRLLRELAQTCRRVLRSTDVIGRLGGEEFGVLLPETNLDGAVAMAARLREAVESMRVVAGDIGEDVKVTVSMGLAEFGESEFAVPDTLDMLYERVDKALYEAKSLGRNMAVASREPSHLRAVV